MGAAIVVQALPESALAESRTLLLLIHGTADTNVPIDHARGLLQHQRPGLAFWEAPGGQHVRIRGAHAEEYADRVYAFFDARKAIP